MMVFPPFHRFFLHHPEELGLHVSLARWEAPLWVLIAATAGVYLAGSGCACVRVSRLIFRSTYCSPP